MIFHLYQSLYVLSQPPSREALLSAMLTCDIIVYNISDTPETVSEASWAVETLHGQLASFAGLKVFICISTVLTWARSKPVDPVSDIMAFPQLCPMCQAICRHDRKIRVFLSLKRTIGGGALTLTSKITLKWRSLSQNLGKLYVNPSQSSHTTVHTLPLYRTRLGS